MSNVKESFLFLKNWWPLLRAESSLRWIASPWQRLGKIQCWKLLLKKSIQIKCMMKITSFYSLPANNYNCLALWVVAALFILKFLHRMNETGNLYMICRYAEEMKPRERKKSISLYSIATRKIFWPGGWLGRISPEATFGRKF